jgi:hypothetical protein
LLHRKKTPTTCIAGGLMKPPRRGLKTKKLFLMRRYNISYFKKIAGSESIAGGPFFVDASLIHRATGVDNQL